MNIALAADEKFFPGLWAAVLSCIASATRPCDMRIYVIDCGLAQSSWKRLDDAVHSHPDPPQLIRTNFPIDRLSGLHLPKGKSPLTYARLFFPEVFDCDTLLHIDADMLIFKDVFQLEKIDISSHAGAAAGNQDGDTLGFDLPSAWCVENGLDPQSPYFNAGLFYMNLKQWREQSLTQRCLEFMNDWNPTYVDQTAINAVMNHQIVALDQSWNRLVNRIEPDEFLNPKCVIHYTNDKPWLVKQRTPGGLLFEKFCRDSGLRWPDPSEQKTVWDKFEYLNLPRGIAYQFLGFLLSLRGNAERASAYRDAGAHWKKWFADRKTRKKNYARAEIEISGNCYTPDWLK